METKSTTPETLVGICTFCKGEFEKKKIAQHLRYCKPRVAGIKALAANPTEEKTRILYIYVEGRDKPQYWMYLEVPASEPLSTLDTFLRRIWLQEDESRSGFKIGETFYTSERDYKYEIKRSFFDLIDDVMIEAVEEEKASSEEYNVKNGANINMRLPAEYMEAFPPDWLAELNNKQSIDDMVSFIKETEKSLYWNLAPEGKSSEGQEGFRKLFLQKYGLKRLLNQIEDRTLGAKLGKVIKIDKKFYYANEYGYGTYFALRVISAREGTILDEEQRVDLLARNVAPVFICTACENPATQIACFKHPDEPLPYCDDCINDIRAEEKKERIKHEKKKKKEEAKGIYTINDEYKETLMIPIANSPAVDIQEDDDDEDEYDHDDF